MLIEVAAHRPEHAAALGLETRKCTGPCGRVLPLTLDHFWSMGRRRDDGSQKYRARCRLCVMAERQAYREAVRAREQEPEPVAKLPVGPLVECVLKWVTLEARVRGESLSERYLVLSARGGPSERTVFAWQHQQEQVHVTVAAEALDALGLQLIDAYPQELLDRLLPPVDLDG
jgi:hypothetical protein